MLGCGPIAQFAHFDACRKARNAELYAICDLADDLPRADGRHPPARRRLSRLRRDAGRPAGRGGDHRHRRPVPRRRPASRRSTPASTCWSRSRWGRTSRNAEALRDRRPQPGLVVQVGNNRRFDPGIAFAARLHPRGDGPADGAQGVVLRLGLSLHDDRQPPADPDRRAARRRRPEGDPKADRRRYFLLTHGSHLVDTARFLGGPIAAVRARLLERFGAYCWFIAVDFADGCARPSRPDRSRSAATSRKGFQIYGEHGSVDGQGPSALVPQVERRRMLLGQGPAVPPASGRGCPHLQAADRRLRRHDPRRRAATRREPRRRPGRRAGDGGDRAVGRDGRKRSGWRTSTGGV